MMTKDTLLTAHKVDGALRYGEDWDKANIAWMSTDNSVTSRLNKPRRYLTSIIVDDHIEHKEEDL